MIPISTQKNLEKAREQGKKVVLVTGVFDLLHDEHKNFLRKAKEVGDFLVVGVESDVRVGYVKGEGRPVETQEIRIANVGKVEAIDEVFILPEEFNKTQEHLELIKLIMPDILAVSANTPKFEKKKVIMEFVGGKVVVVHEHNPTVSTTRIVNGG